MDFEKFFQEELELHWHSFSGLKQDVDYLGIKMPASNESISYSSSSHPSTSPSSLSPISSPEMRMDHHHVDLPNNMHPRTMLIPSNRTTNELVFKRPKNCQRSRDMANCRERERTYNMNTAFSHLKEILPSLPSDKLSKLQILKLASSYIAFLSRALNEECNGTSVLDTQQLISSREIPFSAGFTSPNELGHAFNMRRIEGVWTIP